jgi:hypothetical protein
MATEQPTDAIALLKADHREVEELFGKFEKASSGRKQAIAEKICTELKIHSMIEEEIFYPACEGVVEEADLKEAYVEHDGAKVLINDIMSGEGSGDEFYEAKVKVLQEEIEHHVKEEESGKNSIFGQVREAKELDLKALGQQMFERKQQLMQQAEAEGLPSAQLTTVASEA